MNYRIAYMGDSLVNWCPQLGTVLANDEVSDGSPCVVATRRTKENASWMLRVQPMQSDY